MYCIANDITGRVYVGESTHVRTRMMHHYQWLCEGRHSNKAMQADWTRQGGCGFKFWPIDLHPTMNRIELEKHYIRIYRAEDPRYGYNRRPGAVVGTRLHRNRR